MLVYPRSPLPCEEAGANGVFDSVVLEPWGAPGMCVGIGTKVKPLADGKNDEALSAVATVSHVSTGDVGTSIFLEQ